MAGGVGGDKLALGLSRLLPPSQLVIAVNTGDDESFHGLHVSPDMDTVRESPPQAPEHGANSGAGSGE